MIGQMSYTEVGYTRNNFYDIQLHLDVNEQYGRRDTLEIQGVPYIADDLATQLAIATARLVNVELELNDISSYHKRIVHDNATLLLDLHDE